MSLLKSSSAALSLMQKLQLKKEEESLPAWLQAAWDAAQAQISKNSGDFH